MMRPPLYAQSELLSRAQKKQRKHHTISSTDGGELVVQDVEKVSAASPHVKRKMVKGHVRHEEKQLLTLEHMDPNLPSESLVDKRHSGQ